MSLEIRASMICHSLAWNFSGVKIPFGDSRSFAAPETIFARVSSMESVLQESLVQSYHENLPVAICLQDLQRSPIGRLQKD